MEYSGAGYLARIAFQADDRFDAEYESMGNGAAYRFQDGFISSDNVTMNDLPVLLIC
jgi:hypothetical protein